MKRLTCWIMAAALCCVPFSKSLALTLPADEPVVAYYMPLTQLDHVPPHRICRHDTQLYPAGQIGQSTTRQSVALRHTDRLQH